MAIEDLEKYFMEQQVSQQWAPVLRAMAGEMIAQSDSSVLRQLFVKIGERFAADVAANFEGAQTIDELADLINRYWAQINWGWAEFSEAEGCIEIMHHCAPLAQTFGPSELAWAIGLLEGFYQGLFNSLGANENMLVRSVGDLADGMNLHLRFGNPEQ